MNENWTRIRRFWWLILLGPVVALAVTIPITAGGATTYTSKLALTTYSQNRAPEQDAILIQSYVDFFNKGADQAQLRTQAKVPADVAFTAEPVATGPIMFVVATGDDESQVRSAAVAMGDAFRDSINAGVQKTREDAVATLRAPFVEREARQDFILTQERVELQRQIDQLNADSSGRLQDLNNAVTVTSQSPRMLPAASVATLIGLLVGFGAAWVLGAITPRLGHRRQVADDLGVRAFDAAARTADERRLQMRHVVNAMAFDDLPTPVVLAVTSADDGAGAETVARDLAEIRAAQGAGVVLLRAVRGENDDAPGVLDLLASPDAVSIADVVRTPEQTDGSSDGMSIIPLGEVSTDPYNLMTSENVEDLLGQLRKRFAVIVIECAPVITSAEVTLLCAAADRTVLTVTDGSTRTSRGRLAVQLLGESGAEMFGVVLTAPGRSAARRPARLVESV